VQPGSERSVAFSALMPFARAPKIGGGANVPGIGWTGFADTGLSWRNREDAIKNKGQNPDGRKLQGVLKRNARGEAHWTNPAEHEGRKHKGSRAVWLDTGPASLPSASPGRKAASAMIAKIPLPLARHIGAVYRSSSAC
jgi:hypothetical protein